MMAGRIISPFRWRVALALAFLTLEPTAFAVRLTVKPSQADINSFDLHGDKNSVVSTISIGSTPSNLSPVPLFNPRQDYKSVGDRVTWTNTAPNIIKVNVTAHREGSDGLSSIGVTFRYRPDDIIYGVWEYPWNGSIANRGVSHSNVGVFGTQRGISWSNARAPFFMSRSGFAVYVDSLDLATFDFTTTATVSFTINATSEFSYSIVYHPQPAELVKTLGTLSSRIAMPPDSGYGPIFWLDNLEKEFHGAPSNVEENYYDVVKHLYSNQIRATAMLADQPTGTGNSSYGNFEYDPALYPDPQKLVANLSSSGLDLQVWVANRAFLHTELFKKSTEKGWLFPQIDPVQFPGTAVNLSILEASQYMLDRLTLFPKLGVQGFRIDRGEEHEMPDNEQNRQMTLFIDLCYQAMAKLKGPGNFYNSARSAYDRSRSKTAIWNGDSNPSFEGLAYSVASGIRAGLLGFSQWGSDTGGNLRSGQPCSQPPSEELWARWMQFSAWSPMYEVMVGTGHTPWHAPYSSRLVAILKQTAELHTRMVPYIRSLTYEASQTGLPAMRALFLEYPNDSAVAEISDQYSFGSAFLVAPVVTEKGARSVYFPRGGPGSGKFLDYSNKTAVFTPGTTQKIVDLPWESIPVYVQEGAIVPTGDVFQGNAKWIANWKSYLDIELFPSFAVAESTFEYFRGARCGGTAVIKTRTNATTREVEVTTEDLGIDVRVLVYGKNGIVNVTLLDQGRRARVTIQGFASLFE